VKPNHVRHAKVRKLPAFHHPLHGRAADAEHGRSLAHAEELLGQDHADGRQVAIATPLERGSVEPMIIPDDNHVGAYIRSTIAGLSDALVAVGGGKGVIDLHRAFVAVARPVLPMGLDIGSSGNYGAGAVGLHQRAIESPAEFFPNLPGRLRTTLMTRGLTAETGDPIASAQVVAGLLRDELAVARRASAARPVDVVILGVIPVELAALFRVFGVAGDEARTKSGTRYWTVQLERGKGPPYSAAIAAAGAPGNSLTAAAVTYLHRELPPRLVLLAGIAAGQEGKYRLGEVVIADTVIPCESAALVGRARHEANLARRRDSAGVPPPARRDRVPRARPSAPPLRGIRDLRGRDTAGGERHRSAERDSSYLARLQAEVHGKIDVVEMEAGGLAHACHVAGVPFVVVRGISDFANSAKNDRHHDLAAKGAALVARDLLLHGVDLAALTRP